MSNFWLGVSITIFGNFILSLYSLFFLEEFFVRIRRFLIWLPFNIHLAFITGYLLVFLSRTTNESINALIIIIAFLLGFVSLCIENNLFILQPLWKDGNYKKIQVVSLLLYFVSLGLSLLPYVLYQSLVNTNLFWIIIIFLIVFLLYLSSIKRIREVAERNLQHKLKQIILSFNRYSYSVFSEEHDSSFYFTATIKELELRLEVINKTLSHLYYFFPESSGDLLPGVKNNVIPINRVKAISNEIVSKLLDETFIAQAKLHILIGTDAQLVDGFDIIKNKISEDIANQLKDRRFVLFSRSLKSIYSVDV